jgi:hypothetical protein
MMGESNSKKSLLIMIEHTNYYETEKDVFSLTKVKQIRHRRRRRKK